LLRTPNAVFKLRMGFRFKNALSILAREVCHCQTTIRRGIIGISASSSSIIKVDTLIIGGGPIGSSTAYHLSELRKQKEDIGVAVLEQDPTFQSSSATFSIGGIRQQFSLAENVKMSLYGLEFLRNSKELLASPSFPDVDLQFQEHGYLFLASSADDVAELRANNQVQRQAGCDTIQLMDQTQLKEKFPWMNVDDVALGSYGTSGEGWFDPLTFMRALKEKAKDSGVRYEDALILAAERDKETGNVVAIMVQNQKTGEIQTYHPKNVVNATGARAQSLMTLLAGDDTLQHQIPVKPRKRSVFRFQCKEQVDQQELLIPQIAPMTIDSSSMVYFRPDGEAPGSGTFLCGVSPPKEQDVDCWDPDELAFPDHHLFENTIRHSIAHRVPAFESIEIISSWAGLYDFNTMDQNAAIIDFHPELPNVFMVNGFSGHGLQHSLAAGRAASEKLEYGAFSSLNLELFSFDREL